MRFWNGLKVGGAVRRDLAAYSISVPLLSLHRPGRLCWSWFLEWSIRRDRWWSFGLVNLPGHQSRTILGTCLGDLQFVRQNEN